MRLEPRKIAIPVLAAVLVMAASVPPAVSKKKSDPSSTAQLDERKRAAHALNRLTFGPRPGEAERVLAMGVDRWVDEQLHPEKIDDRALEARLAPFRTLRMDAREMVEAFPPPPVVKAVERGRQPLPPDPAQRAVYEQQIDRLRRREGKQAAAAIPATGVDSDSGDDTTMRADDDARMQGLNDLEPDKRFKAILDLPYEQRRAVSTSIRSGKRADLLEGMTANQKEALEALTNPQRVVSDELTQGKLLRAIYSERQLEEVLTDFWFNHFNVYMGKGADRYLLTSYERDVIRPHVLGKFEDLLVATAQSPAMLFYLDNWLSVGPNSDRANGKRDQPGSKKKSRDTKDKTTRVKEAKGKRGGLNENYGRELMELHTLGVNGGYTQADVTEVARVFTGWTLRQPGQGGGFTYDERMHEPGDKRVLGHRIKPDGEKEGLEVLHLLTRQPATAKFICTKLATRFVADDPPPALVERMTKTFLKKDGNLREVMKTLLHSPEFWSVDAYRAKVKTPLEFVASAARATGAEVSDSGALVRQLQNLGMPLYGMQPPTGYPMKAEAWVNSAALLGRMNFALAFAAGKLKGVRMDTPNPPEANDAGEAVLALEQSLVGGEISQRTHDTILQQVQESEKARRKPDEQARLTMATGLLLGSPEFQRR